MLQHHKNEAHNTDEDIDPLAPHTEHLRRNENANYLLESSDGAFNGFPVENQEPNSNKKLKRKVRFTPTVTPSKKCKK